MQKAVQSVSDRSEILFAVIVAAMGGFLFGYDTAVISGCEEQIQKIFSLSGFGVCGKGPTYAEVFELCEYARKPVPKEVAFLRSLPNVKWIGAEPMLLRKGDSAKNQPKVV